MPRYHITIDGEPRCTWPSIPIFYPCVCDNRVLAELAVENIKSIYLPLANVQIIEGECPIDIEYQRNEKGPK